MLKKIIQINLVILNLKIGKRMLIYLLQSYISRNN